MYWKCPTAGQLKGTGLKPKHYKEPQVEVWPENWPAIDLFSRNHTQIIVGAAGLVGLNYSWLQSCLEHQELDAKEADRIMDGIRVIEEVVLDRAYRDG